MTYYCIRLEDNRLTDFCWTTTYDEAERYVLKLVASEVDRKRTTVSQFYIRETTEKPFGYCPTLLDLKLEAAYDER